MKTTKRFENAVTKLYKAFHDGTLNAFDCTACAVGNIVGNGDWGLYMGNTCDYSVSDMILKEINSHGYINKTQYLQMAINHSDYSAEELLNVETVFLGSMVGLDVRLKEAQFKGLCAVVEYLCELDNIPNVMDYTALFETEQDNPKYELQF